MQLPPVNLKLSWKLALIGISSTLPLLCGAFYLINKYTTKDIHFAVLEQEGIRFLQPLGSLLEALPQHQALVLRSRAGDEAATDQLAAKQNQIDHAFDALQVASTEWGSDLQDSAPDSAQPENAERAITRAPQHWRELKAQASRISPAESVVRHAQLVAEVRQFITQIGNASHLILDPDLDSYYLMDVTLTVLPQTQDRIASLMAAGGELLQHPSLTAAERTQLAVQADQLKESDLGRLVRDVQTALTADAEFHGVSTSLQRELPPAVRAYIDAAEDFRALVNRMAESERSEVSPAEFEAAGANARLLSFKLGSVGMRELDGLLQQRIDDFNQARRGGIGLMALSLLLTAGVTVVVARSINGVERKLRDSREQLRALLARLQRAREEERIRVSREIHDELGQLLTGLKMDVRWLERKLSLPGLPLTLHPLLDRAVAASEMADATIATVQKIASELRPGALDQLGLAAALSHETRRFQERSGVRCSVVVAESWPVLPRETANDFFYICQEALTNVARHAHATHVEIRLMADDAIAVLEVRDDGVGLVEAELNAPRSLGLTGMRERAGQCGGTISFERTKPQGTRVTVRVPRVTVSSEGRTIP